LCPNAMNVSVPQRGYAVVPPENGTHLVVDCLNYLPSGSKNLC